MRKTDASLNDIVQTPMFVTNVNDWPGAAKAHSEYFGDSHRATPMIEISRLMTPINESRWS